MDYQHRYLITFYILHTFCERLRAQVRAAALHAVCALVETPKLRQWPGPLEDPLPAECAGAKTGMESFSDVCAW